jgi:hypothetical protein
MVALTVAAWAVPQRTTTSTSQATRRNPRVILALQNNCFPPRLRQAVAAMGSVEQTERGPEGGEWAHAVGTDDPLSPTQKVKSSSCARGPACRATFSVLAHRSGPDNAVVTPRLSVASEGLASGGNEKSRSYSGLSEAADGTRTHDLLHGKQYVKPRFQRLCGLTA